MQSRSTVGSELGWLLVFVVIFTLLAVLMLKFLVPHHFNDRIAILLSGILAALLFIGLRWWFTMRSRG